MDLPLVKRFWLPRGTNPDLSDDGFLVNPQSKYSRYAPATAVPFESIARYPVLGLLGEPGIGKTTALRREADLTRAAALQSGDRVLWVDLGLYGTDLFLDQKVFQSRSFRSWKKSESRLCLFLDGLDECLHRIDNLVVLLLEFLSQVERRGRLQIRIACRTVDWPPDLEEGLCRLWGVKDVGVYELAPLLRDDVRAAAEAVIVPANEFLSEVDRLGAAPLANRPITLKFLLDSFGLGQGLPSSRTELYRSGCLVLCDEWRSDRRRAKRFRQLSAGQRLAVASRLAAVTTFCRRTAIWTGPLHVAIPEGDVRIEDLLGGEERLAREVSEVNLDAIRETIGTGLFPIHTHLRPCFTFRTQPR